jgi:hypothetical protein
LRARAKSGLKRYIIYIYIIDEVPVILVQFVTLS